jgi:sulfoxide reductase heme-binding subunit YedZ
LSTRRNLVVLTAAVVIVGIPSLVYLSRGSFEDAVFGDVLRTSARLALLIYLVIFSARPLHQLTPSGPTRSLLMNRRSVGVAFAGVMTAHLIFLLWFNGLIAPIPGMIVYALLILMLITSFDRPRAALGPRRWKYLHKTGLYVLGIAFAQAVVRGLWDTPTDPAYLILAALFVIAILLRVTAFFKSRTA